MVGDLLLEPDVQEIVRPCNYFRKKWLSSKKKTKLCLPCCKIFMETEAPTARGLTAKGTALALLPGALSVQILQFSN